ncbi:MAG: hypothetical protein A2550_01875 [Candidatus Jacksonbacteria bacterium RIFOXYD2_FULL_43_21]|nr:MAG: hypothetical protein A2550_01875 [Candidatus Jacksonbacteria bacterium RIFOXYD2_FULL_43_21]
MLKIMLKKAVVTIVLIILALLGIIGLTPEAGKLKIIYFDVGQGDAAYIRTAGGQDILIDAGPSDVILSKLGEAMPFYDRTLDIIILSHPHADHSTGLVGVLNNYSVRQVYLTGVVHTSSEYLEFLKLLKNHPEIEKIKIDHRFNVDLGNETELQFLYPDFDVAAAMAIKTYPFLKENLNNSSVVVRLVAGDQSFLFLGDIEKDVEAYLLTSQSRSISVQSATGDFSWLKSTVIKIPHHGSKTSSTIPFLTAVSPQTAVVSVGAGNSFGHPSPIVLKRLSDLEIKTLRTDLEGDIVISN